MRLNEIKLCTPYLELDGEFYEKISPLPLENPYLISFNKDAAELIGVDDHPEEDIVELINGEFKPEGAEHFSMCYAGHQFGNYNPWLGDGRAHNLGKIKSWNLQLKGSGETMYSRSADGRAVVRSCIREYLMSEAMYHLGIPTTRALGVIGSATKVLRSNVENAAIVMRMSESWIRFGSFEYFYYTKSFDKLKELADYVIDESFVHLKEDDDCYYKMFCEILERTANLIAAWQGIGFCHGVMNTDNMSIAGLTIDYGPFSMLDDFNYGYVCNHTDRIGRYSYGEQPNISYWNLTMLAKAFSPLVDEKRMQKKLDEYGESIYPDAYISVMRKKLGLKYEHEEDIFLIKELVGTLQDAYVDNTLFYRTLSRYDGDRTPLYDIVMEPVIMDEWLKKYDIRLQKEDRPMTDRHSDMLSTNPKYVLKNYMLQEAIVKAEQGDFSKVEELLNIARNPFDEMEQYGHYAGDTPEHYKNIGLSCSS